jgi:hypothetical protein
MTPPFTPRLTSRLTSRRRLTGFAVAAIVALGACGVPSEGDFLVIDDGEIPYGLAETTTTRPPTTTSTTTTPPSTTMPPVTTTVPETTTTLAVETVELYFLTGLQLVPIQRSLASPATPSQVLAALIEGPPTGESGVGLRSALPADEDLAVSVDRGLAMVDLPEGYLTGIAPSEQRRAVAQIVLTISVLPRASLVVFTEGGEEIAVPRGGGDLSDVGEAVTFEDYQNLLSATRTG